MFGWGYGLLGGTEALVFAGLDLNENIGLSLPGDEVDLPQGRDVIALQNLVALLLQGRRGQFSPASPNWRLGILSSL